jgi:hypothetical protein
MEESMDALEFASKLSKGDGEPAVERWADRFQESVVVQTASLVNQLERMSEEMKRDYWVVLGAVLTNASGRRRFVVPSDIRESLMVRAPDDEMRSAISSRFFGAG